MHAEFTKHVCETSTYQMLSQQQRGGKVKFDTPGRGSEGETLLSLKIL